MIKIDYLTTINLDDLALEHYKNLIGDVLRDGINYHSKNSLIGRIEKQKQIDQKVPDQTRVDFWNYVLINLERIVTGRPEILKELINEINDIFGENFFSNNISYQEASLTDFGKTVQRVFNYKLYRSKRECIDNCNKLNLSYCPYCNEQTIHIIDYTYNMRDGLKALHQLDHFYPQSRHPYFGVSFFNLIPGCSICNTILKLDKNFDIETHFNPFHKSLNDNITFELENIMLLDFNDISLKYNSSTNHSCQSIIDFQLINRYEHTTYKKKIYNLIQTVKNYSTKVNQSTRMQIPRLFDNTVTIEMFLDLCNVPINKEDINIHQLGKLKRDIMIQLGILQNI